MLELLDNQIENENIWLSRYMPFSRNIYWLEKGKLKINFSRMEFFDDVLEGWGNNFPISKKAWLEYINYYIRCTNSETGKVEFGKSVISFFLEQFNKNLDSKINLEREIDDYLELIKTNYVSCWFISEKPDDEERYMWNIYGKSPKEKAFKVSIKWTDLKHKLEISNKKFTCGVVNYNDESSSINPIFKKHSSYSHEKEFRIASKDFKEDRNYFIIDNSVQKTITLNEPLASEEYEQLFSNIEKDQIKYSKLPSQRKLIDIIKSL